MLVVTRKEYEIEETVQGLAEDNETVLYEFKMQLAGEDVTKLRELVARMVKLAEKGTLEEQEAMEKEANDLIDEMCFREHKQPFIDVMGQYKYEELVQGMFDFFVLALAEKLGKRADTMNTSLRKITNN